jgi:hypothetical protein
MGRIGETSSDLSTHWRTLQAQWEQTRAQWRDEIGELFEREYWQPLEENMPRLLRSIDSLDQVVEQGLRHTREY